MFLISGVDLSRHGSNEIIEVSEGAGDEDNSHECSVRLSSGMKPVEEYIRAKLSISRPNPLA